MRRKTITPTGILVALILAMGSMGLAQEHAHGSPHGGQVVTVGSYHYEMLVKPKEIQLYVLDGQLKTLPIKGMTGSILILIPHKERKKATLEPVGKYFKATTDAGSAKSFIAIATVKINGEAKTGRFTYAAKKEHPKEGHHGKQPHD